MATYERGVEDETLSCGTGVTAAAISHFLKNKKDENEVAVETKGGNLKVRFEKSNGPSNKSNVSPLFMTLNKKEFKNLFS